MKFLGPSVFFLARLSAILLAVWTMAVPRIGDDALFYLSKGKGFFNSYARGTPMQTEILAQASLPGDAPPGVERYRWRVRNQVSGALYPAHDLFLGSVLATGVPSKIAFAVSELLCATVMTIGLFAFLKVLFGQRSASIGMVLLAFAILPNQGLHYWIPSTLSLSLGLGLWAYLLRRKPPTPIVLFLFSCLLAGMHPMAKVYVLSAAILLAVRARQEGETRGLVLLFLALLMPIALFAVAAQYVPHLATPTGSEMGVVSPLVTLSFNIPGAVSAIVALATQLPLLLALALAWPWLVKGRPDWRIRAVVAVMLVLLLASLFHWLPRYPAETFTRILVLCVVLGAGLAGGSVLSLSTSARLRHVVWTAVALHVGVTSYQWLNWQLGNFNQRPFVLNETVLANTFSKLGDGETIVYLDTEIALRQAMLHGADRFPSVAYPLLDGMVDGDSLLLSRLPAVAVAAAPFALDLLDNEQMKTSMPRRQGFPLSRVATLMIERLPAQTKSLEVLFGERHIPFTVRVDACGSSLSQSIDAGAEKWIKLNFPMPCASAALDLSQTESWIQGIVLERSTEGVHWPWKHGLRVGYVLRSNDIVPRWIDFSFEAWLKSWEAEELIPLLRAEAEPFSDAGGLVFWRIDQRRR